MAGSAARQMIRLAGFVDRGLKLPEQVPFLVTGEDREVVICEVQAGVALGAKRGTVKNQVLGDRGMEDDEGSHCAAMIAIPRLCISMRVDYANSTAVAEHTSKPTGSHPS